MSQPELSAILDSFATALARLHDALSQPKSEWTRDAAIQRFEFTFELAWKTLSRFAEREGMQCASPRQALKAALHVGWIEDEPGWLDMLNDRNRTTHTYREATAEEIYSRLKEYADRLTRLQQRLALELQ